MKRIILLMLGVAGCCIAYADSAREYFNKLDAQTGLYLFSARSDVQPKKGCVYQNAMMGILKVCQTVDGYCTACCDQLDANLIAVKPTSEYADGTFLRKGYYEYVGLTAFTGIGGTPRQFHTFNEIESSIGDEIGRIASAKQELQMEIERSVKLSGEVQTVKKKLAEEVEAEKVRAKNERLKLENEREISRLKVEQRKAKDEIAAQKRQEQKEMKPKLQKEREAYAKSLLKEIDFNVKHHYVVQRSVKKQLSDVKVVDACWAKLQDLQKEEDWLGMLGCIDEEELEEYPNEKIIDQIVKALTEKVFEVSFSSEKKRGCSRICCETYNTVRFAGGSESRWEENNRIGDYNEHDNGVGHFKVKSQLLKGKLHFYAPVPSHGSLHYYVCNVHKLSNGMRDLTPEIIEEYEDWLKEN